MTNSQGSGQRTADAAQRTRAGLMARHGGVGGGGVRNLFGLGLSDGATPSRCVFSREIIFTVPPQTQKQT